MTDEIPTNGTRYRLQELERRVGRIEDMRVDVLAERVTNHAREFSEIGDEIKSLKRALYTFALSISIGAVGFALTVYGAGP